MTDILESHEGLVQRIEHAAQPPDALQTTCSDAALTLRLLENVG